MSFVPFQWGTIAVHLLPETINKNKMFMERKQSSEEGGNVLEAIADGVKNGYLFIENGVVKGYKAIESGAVKGFTAVNDRITMKLFSKDGETLGQTKARLEKNAERR